MDSLLEPDEDFKFGERFIGNVEGLEPWQISLKLMGNVAYRGHIGPERIVRAARFDLLENPVVASGFIDTTSHPAVYIASGERDLMMIRWLLGDELTGAMLLNEVKHLFSEAHEKQFVEYWDVILEERKGVFPLNVERYEVNRSASTP